MCNGTTSPESKRCGTCSEMKPLTEFNRKSSRRDGHQEVCRECNRSSSRQYYKRNREQHLAVIRKRTAARRDAGRKLVAEHLAGSSCVDCGNDDIRVLDFDHRPGEQKRDGVMQLVRNGFSLSAIASEITRCDVRCRNCHAIVTYQRMGPNWRSSAESARGR